MQVVVYTVAAFGLAWVIGYSKITFGIRTALDSDGSKAQQPWVRHATSWLLLLMECPACLGFWIGVVSGLSGLAPVVFSWDSVVGRAALMGMYTCGANYLIGRIAGLIEE